METQFLWTQNWYPVIPLSYLDVSHPTALTLLGKKLVIWRDGNQQWKVMDDVCPHRRVQLSLGSINTEDGTLVCRYHGWCFDGEGICTKIPMSTDEMLEQTAIKNPRSQVQIYPTKILEGLLWVWPDNCSTAFEDCQLKQPATIPECDLDSDSTDWFMSDVPVGYRVSVESSFDPSHAQFLHEGLMIFSPQTAIPIQEFKQVGEMSAQMGFILKHTGYNVFNQDMEATRTFTPPCSNTTIYRHPHGRTDFFQLYFIPTQAGSCRYIGKFFSSETFPQKNNILSLIFKILPPDIRVAQQHLQGYKLGDQDLTALHSEDVICTTQPENNYYLPTVSDMGVITFRKWLDKFAGGEPFENDNIKELSSEQLYDRWHRHTKHCPTCRKAVLRLEKIRSFCQFSAIIFLILALVIIPFGISAKFSLSLVILAGLSLFGLFASDHIRHLFLSSIPSKGLPIVKLYS
ncbi:rieske domain protein [Lyngbya aestuarii BL J]|uniref:Rieske domain protein n=1 Tax=Lyngbya aestuarii BL J TaxID=1348334 RepID=U7QCD2_9CYAN|nr:Rieske 2Fe-2S domain-containing protein [Lyngbya aestuarii]ERT05514.1 rieske domain protein [Lyngbya aestuarii BL J]